MSLINCSECDKSISDKASACPNCGDPLGQSKTLIQMDFAPNKRRKYRIGLLIFVPMFFLGFLSAMSNFFEGNDVASNIWFAVGVLGFIGMAISAIGNWLNKP